MFAVATVLTVCGIETRYERRLATCLGQVATALTVYGIETLFKFLQLIDFSF